MLSVPELVKLASENVRRIDANTAFKEVSTNDGVIIDVREPGEVSSNPTKDTVNIPRGVLEMKVPDICNDPERAIYLLCATGGRATLAAEQLLRIGYANVSAISCDIETIRTLQK
jgi:phage shock protein E